jgi:hypothetical protein
MIFIIKCNFCVLPLFWAYIWKPDNHLPHFILFSEYLPKDQSLKFLQKNIESLQGWKITFFFGFWLLGFSNFVLLVPNENQLGFHMRYDLFLHYGKVFIRTNMHMTRSMIMQALFHSPCWHWQYVVFRPIIEYS